MELRIWCKIGHFFTPNESNEINGVKNRLYLHHFVSIGVCGAKSPEAGGRSKGMAIRGHVSGGDPRSGEDERQRTFRRPPASGRRYMIRVLISVSWRLRSGILLGYRFVAGYVLSHELRHQGSADLRFIKS